MNIRVKRILLCAVPFLLVLVDSAQISPGWFSSGPRNADARDIVRDEAAQGRNDSAPPFQALFSEITCGELQSERLWDAVKDNTFELTSHAVVPGFHFEHTGVAIAPARKETSGFILRRLQEWEGSHVALLGIEPGGLPSLLLCDDQCWTLDNGARWNVHRDRQWQFVVDARHLSGYFDGDVAPAELSGFVRFDLSSYLHGITRGIVPQTQWHPVSRTLEIRTADETIVQLRFRSPDDSLRYGADLGAIQLTANTNAFECFHAFQQMDNSRTRLQLANGTYLMSKLHARDASSRAPSWTVASIVGEQERQAARKLREALTSPREIQRPQAFSTNKLHDPQNLRKLAAVLIMHGGDKIFTDDADKVEATIYARSVAHQLRAMVASVGVHFADNATFPDDPSMIWREIEATYGPDVSGGFYRGAAVKLVLSPLVLRGTRAELCDAVGDWGYPSFVGDGTLFGELMQDPFFDAILRSHWQWPCELKHTVACLDALKTSLPGSGKELAAVEALVRLDALAQVPDAGLDRWYTKHVAVASPEERRKTLSVLSAQPSGREFLIRRLQNDSDERQVRQSIAHTLAARARAALKANRFDFITVERCREILDIAGHEEDSSYQKHHPLER